MANSPCAFLSQQNSTTFTLQQIQDYCVRNDWIKQFTNTVVDVIGKSQWIGGLIGMISYVLMFCTLWKTSLKGCSLIYFQTLTVIEFVHTTIMFQSGLIFSNIVETPTNSLLAVVWRSKLGNGWIFGDGLKVVITMLTLFMTLERFIAIWFPSFFQKINRKSVAWSVVTFCSLYSFLNIFGMFVKYVQYDPKQDQYNTVTIPSLNNIYVAFTNAIYFIYIGVSVGTFFLCVLIVVGLIGKMKRRSKMRSKEDNQEWKTMVSLSVLSLLLGVTMLVNNVNWVVYRALGMYSPATTGSTAVATMTYDVALMHLDRLYNQVCWRLAQNLSTVIVSPGRFLMYVCLSQTVRSGLLKLLGIRSNSITSSMATSTKKAKVSTTTTQ